MKKGIIEQKILVKLFSDFLKKRNPLTTKFSKVCTKVTKH